MNAFTPIIPDAYGFHFRDHVVADPGRQDRVPVFHGRVFDGFLDGGESAALTSAISNHPTLPRDHWINAQIVTSLQADPWLVAEAIEVSVEDGFVRLSGQVDSLHAGLAIRRIAATTPGVIAVVDDLWISCE